MPSDRGPLTELPIPLVAPCITGHDRAYMRQAIDHGLLEHEHEVRKFEEAFAERVGCAGAVAVCSGTAALELALQVLDISAVSIPTYTCVAVRNATRGRNVSYLDSTFDVATARMTIDPATQGPSILTHMFGRMTAHGRKPPFISDHTLSLGATKCRLGVGVCSTHQSKMISTGRGGVVFSDDTDLLDETRRLAYYETHTTNAQSLGMSSTQAALGVSQLQQLDGFIQRRRQIAARYSEQFAAVGLDCPDPDCGSVFFRYMIGVDLDPAQAVEALAARGVEAGRGVSPLLHRLAGFPDTHFPGAIESLNRLLSVPCHPSITDQQAAYIAQQIIEVCAP